MFHRIIFRWLKRGIDACKALRTSILKMKPKNLEIQVAIVLLGAVLVMTLGCTSDQVDTTTQPIQNPTTQNPIIEDVTVENAFELIQKRQNDNDFVIVDVRTQEEFTAGHIKDAIQIDYNSNTFNSELNVLNKKNTYIIYCRSGGRSGNALDIMQDLGFVEVYNILGGIEAWQAEGLPLEVSQVHNPNDQNEKGPTEVAGIDPPSIPLYPGSTRVAYQEDFEGSGNGWPGNISRIVYSAQTSLKEAYKFYMTEFENLDWEFSASGMRITAYTEEEKMVEVNVYESANWQDYTEIEIFWER